MINVHFKLQPKNLWHTLLMPKSSLKHGIQWTDEKHADLTVIDYRRLDGIDPDILFIPIDSADLTDDGPWCARQQAHRAIMLLRSVQLVHGLDNHHKSQGRWLGARTLLKSSLPERNNIPSRAINSMLWHHHIVWNYSPRQWKIGPKRSIDISFMGTSATYHKQHIKDHRRLAIRKGRELSVKKQIGGRVPIGTYLDIMCDSKIVLSPWGFGPLCYRDFEAVLRGCTIIKPCYLAFETMPNPLTRYSVYHCHPDFRDLKDIVNLALTNWKDDYEKNDQSRKKLRDMIKKPEVYFNALKQVLFDTQELKAYGRTNNKIMASKDLPS